MEEVSELTRGVDGDRMAALFGRCLHLHAETSGGVSTFKCTETKVSTPVSFLLYFI